jgi:hypothetical protein
MASTSSRFIFLEKRKEEEEKTSSLRRKKRKVYFILQRMSGIRICNHASRQVGEKN